MITVKTFLLIVSIFGIGFISGLIGGAKKAIDNMPTKRFYNLKGEILDALRKQLEVKQTIKEVNAEVAELLNQINKFKEAK